MDNSNCEDERERDYYDDIDYYDEMSSEMNDIIEDSEFWDAFDYEWDD